jgi:ketosteroid isomerase-like protein
VPPIGLTLRQCSSRLLGVGVRLGGYIFRVVLVAAAGAMMEPVHAEQSAQKSELEALSNAWIEAEVRNDAQALERLLDERFLVTFASGATMNRAEFIEWVRKAEIKPFQVTNESIVLHGDTAVVISVNSERTVKFTWVAVKNAQRWRVVLETFSRVAAPK